VGCSGVLRGVVCPRMVATMSAYVSLAGGALTSAHVSLGGSVGSLTGDGFNVPAGFNMFWSAISFAYFSFAVTRAICLSRIESALSISVRSSNSSNSSATFYTSLVITGGARSLPFIDARTCCATVGLCGVLGVGLSAYISTNNPVGGTRILAASCIIFGVEDVVVADIVGVGAASDILHVRVDLRGVCDSLFFVPSVYALIIASKRLTSAAIVLTISRFSRAASV
jgi:hypothetical protein